MNLERVYARDEKATRQLLKEKIRLIDKISKPQEFDGTDPRGTIYALLGLVSDSELFSHLISS